MCSVLGGRPLTSILCPPGPWLLFSCSVVSKSLTPRTAACQPPLSELAQVHVHHGNTTQPSHPLSPLLLPSIFPSIRVFSNEFAVCIMWPEHWSSSIRGPGPCPCLTSWPPGRPTWPPTQTLPLPPEPAQAALSVPSSGLPATGHGCLQSHHEPDSPCGAGPLQTAGAELCGKVCCKISVGAS